MSKLFYSLVTILISCVLMGQNAFADDFDISISDDNRTIIIEANGNELEIGVNEDCDIVNESNNFGFNSCAVVIGDLEMSEVSAQIGKDGVGFSIDNGLNFGSLELGAGELQFALMTGREIGDVTELPEVIGKIESSHFYLYADVSSSITASIEGNEITLPSPVDVEASIMLDLTGILMFYSGPIPNPTMLFDGANKFVKSATLSGGENKGIISGAFGFSETRAFKFQTSHDVFESSKGEPVDENFKANIVMIGEFDLADFISVEGDLFLDAGNGHLGINGIAAIGMDVLGAGISMEVADGSFLIDGDGVRFGLGSDPSADLPDELAYIAQFAKPSLKQTQNVYGLAASDGDFLFRMELENMSASGIDSIDGAFEINPRGLDVDAKFQLDGVGKVKVSGNIDKDDCELTAEKIKIFDIWEMKNASVSFCEMLKEGAYAFAGEIKALGLSIPVSGIADAADSAASTLDKDVKASTGFAVKKKFGVGGSGIAGGYVKLTASGDVDLTLNAASGKFSSDVDLDGKAKFCGKVKVAGFKKKQCKTTHSGISQSLDVSTGCFTFDADKKILGKTFKIDAGKVCPFPAANEDSSDYSDDNLEDGDTLDEDDLGVVVALKDYQGKYVTWDDDLILRVSNNFTDKSYFSFINKDDGECPMNGSKLSIQVGDGTDSDEHYWRVKKDKHTALNAQSGDDDDGSKAKKRFWLNSVQMSDKCISDGDTIKLKNKEYGRWVTSGDDDTLVAPNDEGGDNRVFTVVFVPDEE